MKRSDTCEHCGGKIDRAERPRSRYCGDACKVNSSRASETTEARERRLTANRDRMRSARAEAARQSDTSRSKRRPPGSGSKKRGTGREQLEQRLREAATATVMSECATCGEQWWGTLEETRAAYAAHVCTTVAA